MAVRPKGNQWQVDFMIQGKRYRPEFSTELAAKSWELQARAALMQGLPLPPIETPTQQPSTETIDWLVRHVSRQRWAAHKAGQRSTRNAELFAEWVGISTPIAQALTTSKISEYVDSLLVDGTSGSTVNRRLAAVSVLCRFAGSLDKITKLPLLPWQKEGEGRLRWFSDEEEKMLMDTANQWGETKYVNLFTFLIDTGCRLGEARKLDWDCFSKDWRFVTFWETKAGNHRTIPLTSRLRAQLTEAKRLTNETGPYASINPWTLRSFWERLRTHHPQLEDTVVHTFRHTTASRLVQRGIELVKVKEWMGHRAIQTTLRYAHLSPKHLEDAASVLEQ